MQNTLWAKVLNSYFAAYEKEKFCDLQKMRKEECMRRFVLGCISIILTVCLVCGCGKTQWEPQIIEEEIVIEGLEGEYEILFLTDTHMIVKNEADSQEVKEYAASRYEEFHNSVKVSSADQFKTWINYANKEALDGVLFGGDIIDYPSEANLEHLKGHLESLQMPYLYTMGNHDWTYPWDYMTETSKKTYLPMLKESVGSDLALQTLDFGEFVVVAVDNSTNQISAESLIECEEVLEQGKPVIIVLHVPLVTQSVLTKAREEWGESRVVLGAGNYGGIYPDEISSQFMDMITAKDSPVEAVLAGHVHFYDKDMIDGEKKVLQIVGDGGFKGNAVRLRIKG